MNVKNVQIIQGYARDVECKRDLWTPQHSIQLASARAWVGTAMFVLDSEDDSGY